MTRNDHPADDHPTDQQRWATPDSPTVTNWIAEDERMNRMLATFGDRAIDLAALRPGQTVIDVGCGTGRTTLTAWRAVGPDGSVLGVDVSAEMLAHARERCSQIPGISFAHADAQIYPFPPACADAVISRFGIAHFTDTPVALVNLRQALRPGGRIALTEWAPEADNVWMTLIGTVARRVLPAAVLRRLGGRQHADQENPDPGHADHGHAHEFADADSIRDALVRSGWSDVRVELVKDRAWLGTSADDITEWVFRSELPSGFDLLDEVLRHRFRSALTRELDRYTDADGVRLPAAAWLVSGVNPS